MSAGFLQNQLFHKKSFRNSIRVSNGLDTDQDRHNVGPDLGPNCLQMLSVDDKSRRWQGKSRWLEIFAGILRFDQRKLWPEEFRLGHFKIDI